MTLREESGNGPPPDGSAPAGPQDEPLPAGPPGEESPGGPQEPPATPAAGGDPPTPAAAPAAAPTGRAGPPGPARRRRAWPAFLIGGTVAICLLGGLSFVLLQHGRTQATQNALPSVFRLRTGECVDYSRNGISSPSVVPCGQPHDAEIYARFALAEHHWPGTAAIGAQARQGCTARLGSYLNPQLAATILAESYIFPDRGAWNAGERTVICEIRGTAGKLTGSVRGLG
jgi:Septum formation